VRGSSLCYIRRYVGLPHHLVEAGKRRKPPVQQVVKCLLDCKKKCVESSTSSWGCACSYVQPASANLISRLKL